MTRIGYLTLATIVLMQIPGFAQGGGFGGNQGEPWNVKIETFNDRTITGKLNVESVEVIADEGKYTLKPDKVKLIQFNKDAQTTNETQHGILLQGEVVLTGDGKIPGRVNIPTSWIIEIEIGDFTLNPKRVKAIHFVSKCEPKKLPKSQ